MRLSDIFYAPKMGALTAVDPFLPKNGMKVGRRTRVDVGPFFRTYFCSKCEMAREFHSEKKLNLVRYGDNLFGVSTLFQCACGYCLGEYWGMFEGVDSDSRAPKVSLICESLRQIDLARETEESVDRLLRQAREAYSARFGYGAMVYLRIVYERVTRDVAKQVGVSLKGKNGGRKNFKSLLQEVDGVVKIIPRQYQEEGYKLFGELSEVIHGSSSEKVALDKFDSCLNLVEGVVRSVNDIPKFADAKGVLWPDSGDGAGGDEDVVK